MNGFFRFQTRDELIKSAGIKEEPNEIKSLQEKIDKQSDEISKLEIMIIELSKRVNNLQNKFTPFK